MFFWILSPGLTAAATPSAPRGLRFEGSTTVPLPAWPPAYTFYGTAAPFAPSPHKQVAPNVYLVTEWSVPSISDPDRGGGLSEDNFWDRHYIGYLEPGETATVQQLVNQALAYAPCTKDLNGDGACNVLDVQRVTNAALGGMCVSG